MYDVGLYRKVRLACHRDGMSARICREERRAGINSSKAAAELQKGQVFSEWVSNLPARLEPGQ